MTPVTAGRLTNDLQTIKTSKELSNSLIEEGVPTSLQF